MSLFNDNNFSIEREIKEKFYKPQIKSVDAYKHRINERWEKVGASIKRGFMQTSILLGLGVIGLVAQVHA